MHEALPAPPRPAPLPCPALPSPLAGKAETAAIAHITADGAAPSEETVCKPRLGTRSRLEAECNTSVPRYRTVQQ